MMFSEFADAKKLVLIRAAFKARDSRALELLGATPYDFDPEENTILEAVSCERGIIRLVAPYHHPGQVRLTLKEWGWFERPVP
jgi:hypothetical protein